ncbi:hypothetical protein B5G28_08385 [Faecalibacterium sp. An77]|uniref:glycosyltransferase family 4 protein n=1 Tax=Faecalibacterium sp. An77 TaxID=1965655 RepID=UPI000B36E297|nr:glycosyltransferase family 4 protein [Faecalibacterium sp. An77]OUN38699.1 hypothetical protein B5G28_08385 [Faecalibacterium sp. An77]
MKILIVRCYPTYMSVSKSTYNIQEVGLAKAFTRAGHKCDIILWTEKEEETVEIPVDKRKIIVYYKKGLSILNNVIFLNQKQLLAQYDIIHVNEYNQIQAWYYAQTMPRKTVIYHGSYYSPFNKRFNMMCRVFDSLFLRSYLKKGTHFLVKSHLAKKFLCDKGIKPENIKVVGVGIDVDALTNVTEACTSALYHSISNDISRLKMLYIGRIEPRRNVLFLLEVFARVLKRKPDARLYMIGTGEAKYMGEVKKKIRTLRLEQNLCWEERIEQRFLSDIYKAADVFLLTTEYEIFGMVLLEAMYYHCVVMTTHNGGAGVLIQDGENGFVLDMDNANRWAERISEISKDTDRMQMIKDAAHKTIADHFTWDHLAGVFVAEYRKVMGEEAP